MKLRHALILLVLGYCVEAFGMLQKILHTPKADTILSIGIILIIGAWLIILTKLLTHPKIKEFLNW
jgi:hypothetical protein